MKVQRETDFINTSNDITPDLQGQSDTYVLLFVFVFVNALSYLVLSQARAVI